MSKIFVLGGVSLDTIIHLKELPNSTSGTIFAKNSFISVGSTGSGKALSLKKLGENVTLHGVVGDDESGKTIKKVMLENNVRFIEDIDHFGTETHTNLMDEDGNRISIYTNMHNFDPKVNQHLIEETIIQSDEIVLNIINYCRYFIPFIKAHDKRIWVDIHDYDGVNPYHLDFIDASDILFMSSERMPDYKPFMKQQIACGKELVVCTHGKNGATCLTKEGKWLVQDIIPKTKVVDTNGAGDNFFAGFMAFYLKGYSIEKCLIAGSLSAKLCVEHVDIVSPLLSFKWVESHI